MTPDTASYLEANALEIKIGGVTLYRDETPAARGWSIHRHGWYLLIDGDWQRGYLMPRDAPERYHPTLDHAIATLTAAPTCPEDAIREKTRAKRKAAMQLPRWL